VAETHRWFHGEPAEAEQADEPDDDARRRATAQAAAAWTTGAACEGGEGAGHHACVEFEDFAKETP